MRETPAPPPAPQGRQSQQGMLGSEAERVSSNPLVREPRAVHDSVVLENASAATPQTTSQSSRLTVEPVSSHPQETRQSESRRQPESREELRHEVRQQRISGPSFLGLSDPPESSGSEYLLEDDASDHSHWRGLIFLLVLLLVAVGAWRHWDFVKSKASAIVQRATAPNQAPQMKPSAAKSDEANPEAGSSGQGAAATAPDSTPAKTPPIEVQPQPDASQSDSSKPKQVAAAQADQSSAASVTQKSGAAGTATDSKSGTQQLADSSAPADAKPQSDRDSTESDVPAAKSKTSEAAAPKSQPPRYDNSKVELADKYIHGRGVPQNCTEGLALLQQAGAASNPRALIQLGAMYQSGSCVTQDRPQAYKWFAKALSVQPNNRFLEYDMTSLWASMTDEERQRAMH